MLTILVVVFVSCINILDSHETKKKTEINFLLLNILSKGFAVGSFPFKYLVVPLSPHRLLASQFSPLLHKLQAAIQSWVGKHLSYARRLVLLRSVLYDMVQFWISIFPLPNTIITNIIRLCRNFLWTSNVQKSHSALVD